MKSIYDLMAEVRKHPDFVFGTIFTVDDFDDLDDAVTERVRELSKHAEERICEAGWDFIEFVDDTTETDVSGEGDA